jgi:hypothetical protein
MPDAIYLHSRRSAARLPKVFERSKNQVNQNFTCEQAKIGREIHQGQAYLVYFYGFGRQENPTEAEILDGLNLTPVFQNAEGKIYGSTLP